MTAAHKRTLICLATALLALVLACGFLFSSAQVAEALLPDSWNTAADNSAGDWYLDGDNLDVDGLKSVIDWWKSSDKYDFSSLAEDPVVIAVIDSGVNSDHDIFGGENCPDVFLRDETGKIVGANTAGGTSFEDDASDRHGTHVAGIIAVLIHAFDLEDYIKIMPIKAGASQGTGTSFNRSQVDEAINFAIANGADVINMSLTTPKNTEPSSVIHWDSLFTDSRADEAVFIAAAGNDGLSSANHNFYPAESENVVGVMNYTENTMGTKVLSSSSNYGSGFDIAAPGYGILSANGATDDRYKLLTGTSMASPVVAFAAALLTVRWRATTEEEIPDYVSEAQCVKQALALHTTDTAYSTKDNSYYPVLDLESLLVKNFVYSEAKGEMVVSEDSVSVSVNYPSEDIVLGIAGTLELEAVLQSGENPEEYDFVWRISAEDYDTITVTGRKVSVAYDAFVKASDITVTLELYSKRTGTLKGTDTLTLTPVYQSADSDSDITVGGNVVGGDGVVADKVESGTEISLDNADYLSPDVEIIWYVDGEEAARGKTFAPTFKESGQHTVTVVVSENGTVMAEYTAVIYFEKEKSGNALTQFFEDNKDAFIIVGVVLGVLIVIAVSVLIAIAVRGRRRA